MPGALIDRLCKPWFVYRPSQLIRRVRAGLRPPPPGYVALPTSWGAPIVADPSRAIGRSILTTGVYDLAVSEVLARLIAPGDTVVDAGANVGYMTVLASLAAGEEGRVMAFEPHPDLFAVARGNVDRARRHHRTASVALHQCALGDHNGVARLHMPSGFEGNDGTSRLAVAPDEPGRSIEVRLERLDDAIGGAVVDVLKLDVEGFEAQVLRGASGALAERRLRHVVFEDHDVRDSEAVRILRGHGYHLFSLGWSLGRLRVQPLDRGDLAHSYEAPSFIATVEPEAVTTRCRPGGWRVLDPRSFRPDLRVQRRPYR